ncbi:hypothetical protein [Streptosporangium minutum]|nr:hypothetical protein [Streptosporangium minutum]
MDVTTKSMDVTTKLSHVEERVAAFDLRRALESPLVNLACRRVAR